MGEKRRTFTRGFKGEVVRLVNEGREVGELSRELGIRVDTLRKWVEQAEGRAGLRGEVGKRTESEEEIRRLRRELAVAKEELDFVKKAAAYFASLRK